VTTVPEFDPKHFADQVALWIEVDLLDQRHADAESVPVRKEWLAALLNDRKRLQAGHQWRIRINGYPNSGCWIDVTDGDFQNLNVVGRLEFRAKPEASSENERHD
jgi:hypothetical protein